MSDENAHFIRIGRNIPGAVYRPSSDAPASRTAVLVMHSDSDYLSFSAGRELSNRGHLVLCANVSNSRRSLDDKIAEVGQVVDYLRARDDVDRIVLLGHSGGGTLLSAYQNLAENGAVAFQGADQILPAPDALSGLPEADALMLVDSNWGNGAMRVFSLDPAVQDERGGLRLDPDLDLFSASNGFTPTGSHYSSDFIHRFQQAQGERNNRTIAFALDRLEEIDAGRGDYLDDEPFVIPGAEQAFRNNRLYAQDIRLMSRTVRPHELIRLDGSSVHEVIRSLRGPENNRSYTSSFWQGALVTTVRTFLNSWAVRTTPDYGYDEATIRGIDWSSSYNCTTGNIAGISAPLLVLGMTGGWEFAAAEGIYDRATSADKTLAYIEGADHMLRPIKGADGDTVKHSYDFIDRWLRALRPARDAAHLLNQPARDGGSPQ